MTNLRTQFSLLQIPTIIRHSAAFLSHITSKLRTVTSDVWTTSNAHFHTHKTTPAGDVADLSEQWPGFSHTCDLWWIKWHWDRSFSFRVFRFFPVSIIHQRTVFIHSSLKLYRLSKLKLRNMTYLKIIPPTRLKTQKARFISSLIQGIFTKASRSGSSYKNKR
jgi:hypothetical protein